MRRVALPGSGPSRRTTPLHFALLEGRGVRATRREAHRAMRHPKQPRWWLPFRAPLENWAKASLRNPLPVRRRVASMKKKERPPKDARPKEKRFRHGGRKGRRAARHREDSKSR